jgi:hypothetical protein
VEKSEIRIEDNGQEFRKKGQDLPTLLHHKPTGREQDWDSLSYDIVKLMAGRSGRNRGRRRVDI